MSTDNHKGDRIAKVIARAGLCSRRDAERWIADGRVAVNGSVLDTPAFLVSDEDNIVVDGKPLKTKTPSRVFLYHKPVGVMTTHKDEHGRTTVFESLPKTMPRVISVGRLDLNTEGLLILTTDGAVSRHMELPSTGWVRQYRVRVFGTLDHDRIASLAKGVTIDGVRYKPVHIKIENEGKNSWLHVKITEGKNREIRKIMDHMDLQVSRLIRTDYGPFSLGKLEPNAVEEVERKALVKIFPEHFK